MIFVLDAAALLNNENFYFEEVNEYYVPSLVFAEWQDFRSRSLAENALSSKLLVIQDPCPVSVQKAQSKASETNTELSDADVSVVALAIEFMERKSKFVVITDDYSVQNVLSSFGIKFSGVVQDGIKKPRRFKKKSI